MSSESGINWILYDGDCPFCSNYVAYLRFREAVGAVKLVNARDGGSEFEYARASGLNLDEGMVFHYEGRLYHGDECMHMLALLSSSTGVVHRVTTWVFRSQKRAALIYPLLRAGRNATLKLIGKSKISKPA